MASFMIAEKAGRPGEAFTVLVVRISRVGGPRAIRATWSSGTSHDRPRLRVVWRRYKRVSLGHARAPLWACEARA